ncbi:MAG: ribosome maturation factor RimM [Candidatus Amulumruptor caecigallinarius]|nr:ribosome maturation factor RimM [Candidatus Amulumruptor caecigallinarius]
MIKKEDIIEIGKFRKTHALQGELNATLDVDEDFVSDHNPLIVEIDGIYVPFFASWIRTKGATSFLVKLKGLDSGEEAQKLVNKIIYGRREDLVEYMDDPDMQLVDDFIDYKVIDRNKGCLGTVVYVDNSTANTLFEVETDEGDIIYVPVADEFVEAVDDDNCEIIVNLPDGLVELNKQKKDE